MVKEGPSPPVSVYFKICPKSRVLFSPLRAPSTLSARGPHMAKSGPGYSYLRLELRTTGPQKLG